MIIKQDVVPIRIINNGEKNLFKNSSKIAVEIFKLHPKKKLEVEVESIHEFEIALKYKPDIIMLDNFEKDNLIKAVSLNKNISKLEASGNITKKNIKAIAETGVDFISMGSLTKNIKAIDLSLKFYERNNHAQ